jgi:hypothetical protein
MASSAERVKQHREALRRAGLRPVQLWVPDTRTAEFKAECRKQCEALRDDPHETKVLAWVESVSDTEGCDPHGAE